ncbi:protein of unknown function [Taphrina deformans PYCC 5710]|uniref:Reverse transcriptase domain-containing protein n=1 Tax=Taphrina deformans (strain PYCC 5710 / ATCC 11124 / CBS 356.35 / IMI 108563 / JCM 9778 / NBRC 8474) TaxID=1097556 RepID=R4XG28_TAPDE|nr:protein of unknown function [Taphrina deformans PYCC 5710]|eukprot:CCG84617.1 protein of unknown function [Taphrina deformans PYCC 5710]
MSSAYVAAATTFSKDFDLREHRSTPRGYITNLLWAVQHFSIRYLTTTKEGYRQKASLIAHDINTEAVQELAMNHSSNISVDDRSVTSSYATIKSYAESYKLDVARIETSRRKRLQNEERRPTAFTREAIFQSKGSVVQIPKLDDPLGIGSSTSESGLIRSRIANFYEALHTPDDVAFRNTTYKEEVDAFLSMSVKPGTLKEGIGKATRNSIQVDMDVEEVFAATKKANMASAAGNSGIPYRFWLIFHSIFGARLVALANYMMKGGELGQSDPIIPVTILYKRGTRSDIRNYRPISLIDTHLRILLIAITTRLGKAFTRIIPDKQTAFIPKRSIIMNVLTVILALEWGGPSLSTNTSTVFPD